jgi:hypothetical protein
MRTLEIIVLQFQEAHAHIKELKKESARLSAELEAVDSDAVSSRKDSEAGALQKAYRQAWSLRDELLKVASGDLD